MFLKTIAIVLMGAALGYVIVIWLLAFVCELVREWNTQNWWL